MLRYLRPGRASLMIGLAVLWVTLSACSCGDAIATLTRGKPAEAVVEQAAPTATLRAATVAPTSTLPAPTRAPQAQNDLTLPAEPNQPFDMTVTAQEINDYLAGQSLDQEGVEVRDVRVAITDREVIATLQATYAEMGVSAGVEVRGVPVAHNGEVFVQVNKVTLDQSISGFTRLIANQIIDQAIKQYSTEQGIPVPVEGVEVQTIELAPQTIRVIGRTR